MTQRQIRKTSSLNKHEYYETHLSIVNCFLPVKLTPKEIEVLARFMELEGAIAEDRFGTTARRIIKSALNLTDGGLSNYMRSLKDKKFLYLDPQTDRYNIHPKLVCGEKEQEYSFKLENIEA